MPAVAEILRSAREAQKLSIHEVAEATKIKSDHVRALEAGTYQVFTAPVFVRGFVRTYARFLKLDSERIVRDLEQELGLEGVLKPSGESIGQKHGPIDYIMFYLSQVKWTVVGPLLILGLILVGAVFGTRAWLDHRSKDPLAGLQPGVYQPSSTKHAEVLPVPPVKR